MCVRGGEEGWGGEGGEEGWGRGGGGKRAGGGAVGTHPSDNYGFHLAQLLRQSHLMIAICRRMCRVPIHLSVVHCGYSARVPWAFGYM